THQTVSAYVKISRKPHFARLLIIRTLQAGIAPATNRYRLSLVYNVSVKRQKAQFCSKILLPVLNEKYVHNVCLALTSCYKDIKGPTKLIIPLDYEYKSK
ncbi:unnamed protein product, partial [Didymodactylos carnosus]